MSEGGCVAGMSCLSLIFYPHVFVSSSRSLHRRIAAGRRSKTLLKWFIFVARYCRLLPFTGFLFDNYGR